ncbi:MAG: glycosyltransferase [Candidatus Andersenbacteria bacterium]|nr:glycosyltransferase [Candidatus Andersenbacteria bacterium]MBI3250756.1 glycosyltransferase [Candidatus Andersenbacteria bacterium]
MKTCDIIVPTYNNAETLPLVLEELNRQEIVSSWKVRVLLCDDGSTDATREMISRTKYCLETISISGEHHGAAAARNRGIKASRADILLFLGADIILRPSALAAHLSFHEQHPSTQDGALGFVMWDPRLRPTPLMQWAIHGGPQNDFDTLLGEKIVDARKYLYGSNLSLKRDLISSDLFSEQFTGYGHEDTELGDRLATRGLRLHILERATGLHHHFYSTSAFLKRQYAAGKSRHLYAKLLHLPSPESEFSFRHRLQLFLYPFLIAPLLTSVVRLTSRRYTLPRLFSHAAAYAYRRGVVAGIPRKLSK